MARTQRDERIWRRRPWLSRGLRTLILLVPIGSSIAISILLTRLVPRPDSVPVIALWWSSITVASITVLVGVERLGRRLLPLAALLNLSLIFPDRAPARFAVARQSRRVSDVESRLREAQERGARGEEVDVTQHVLTLVAALSVHDRPTRGHSERVRVLTDMLAAELGLSQADQMRLRWAALLHDIGKLSVEATLLNKPGRPDEDEWEVLRRHPEEGARLVSPLVAFLGEWAFAVEHHHERWDGKGYPRGLRGEEISLGGRIVAVADVYETITSGRPYSASMAPAAAREELVRCSGTQFDPVVVRAFLTISVGRLWRLRGPGPLLAQLPLVGRLLEAAGRAGALAGSGAVAAGAAASVAVSGVLLPPSPPPGDEAVAAHRLPPALSGEHVVIPATPAGTAAVRPPGRAQGRAGATPGPTPQGRTAGGGGQGQPAGAPSNASGGGGTATGVPPAPGGGSSGVGPVVTPPPPSLPPPAPALVVSVGGGTGQEGRTFSGSARWNDTGAGVVVTVDYGDGTAPQPLVGGAGEARLTHVYGDEGAFTVTVSVTTPDRGAASGSAPVTVIDVAPSVALDVRQAGAVITGTVTVADPSVDPITVEVDFGDGTQQDVLVGATTVRSGVVAHAYALPGAYTVEVTAKDDDRSKGKAERQITVG